MGAVKVARALASAAVECVLARGREGRRFKFTRGVNWYAVRVRGAVLVVDTSGETRQPFKFSVQDREHVDRVSVEGAGDYVRVRLVGADGDDVLAAEVSLW